MTGTTAKRTQVCELNWVYSQQVNFKQLCDGEVYSEQMPDFLLFYPNINCWYNQQESKHTDRKRQVGTLTRTALKLHLLCIQSLILQTTEDLKIL